MKRFLAVGIAEYFEWRFKCLARNRTLFAVGKEMADSYRQVTKHTHLHVSSLVTAAEWRRLARLNRDEQANCILFVGRLSWEKGVQHLLAALSILAHNGTVCMLKVAGEGPARRALEAQAASAGIGEQVKFHGSVP